MRAVFTGAPMYLTYFGLAEAPFSTTPDQRFLYLSERHREGIAHLLYGVAERGGFVQLTGEVGTGKTTLCRYLLEHVPELVDVALILNPTLTRIELLQTLCDELRVAPAPDATTVKGLVDAISARLLDAHARGRRTIVIVDEAQHLTVEVLEQLRLLTNLETANAKLLQIILVGQPELLDLLRRTDLRQVAQRVAARYHLTPLSEPEARAYVRHRLSMAGQTSESFAARALRAVHRATGGVPRLMNVLCDRALLGAYAERTERVTATIVRRAAREIAGEIPGARQRRRRQVATAAAAAAIVLAVGSALLASMPLARTTAQPAPAPAVAASVVAAPVVQTEPVRSLRTLLADGALATDPDSAWAAVAAAWGGAYERRGSEKPCDAVRRRGLDCIVRRGTWTVVRRLDLPAVLELVSPDGARHYLAVTAVDDQRVTVQVGARRERVAIAEIEQEWDGSFVVLWKPPRVGLTTIGPGVKGPDIAWLRQRLHDLDGAPVGGAPRAWDPPLATRVTTFQRQQGLFPDGIAGEETLARLTTVLEPTTPSLRRPRSGS
jgi:general secretion pathway protein A